MRLLALPPSPLALLASAALVCLPDQLATPQGLLAYDPDQTPARLVPVLAALSAPRIGRPREPGRLPDHELEALLVQQFHLAAINLGHQRAVMDETTLNKYVNEVADLLRERWFYLTRAEVAQVFRLGSLAQLLPPPDRDGRPTEEVIYLSPKTVAVWLERYKYQVKPEAMRYASRVEPPRSELPTDHPVYCAYRIGKLAALAAHSTTLFGRDQATIDPQNLLYLWLKALGAGAIAGRRRRPRFWQRLYQKESFLLCRRGRFAPDRADSQAASAFAKLIRAQLPPAGKLADRVLAACRWRTLCLWLNAHRALGTDLPALLWPLALAQYAPPTRPAPC